MSFVLVVSNRRLVLVWSAVAMLWCLGSLGGCIFNIDEVTKTSKDMSANNITPLDMHVPSDMRVSPPDQGRPDQGPDQGPADMRVDPPKDMNPPTDMNLCEAGDEKLCCQGTLVDSSKDPQNCGGCNNLCGRGDACVLGACVCKDGAVGQPLGLTLDSTAKLLFVPYLGPERFVGGPNDLDQRISSEPTVHSYTLAAYTAGNKTLSLYKLNGRGEVIGSVNELTLFDPSVKTEIVQVVIYPQVGGALQIGAWIKSEDGQQIVLFKAVKDPVNGNFKLDGVGMSLGERKSIVGLGVNKYNNTEDMVLVFASQTSDGIRLLQLSLDGVVLNASALPRALPPVIIEEPSIPLGGELQVSLGLSSLNISWLSSSAAVVGSSVVQQHSYKQLFYTKSATSFYQGGTSNFSSYDSGLSSAKTKSQALWQLNPNDPAGWQYFHGREVSSSDGVITPSLSLWNGQSKRQIELITSPKTLIDQDWAPRASAPLSGELVWIEGLLATERGGKLHHANVAVGIPPALSPPSPLSEGNLRYDQVLTSFGSRTSTGVIGVMNTAQGKVPHFFMSVDGQAVCTPKTWLQSY